MFILQTNFASYNFIFTEGRDLKEAIRPWLKDNKRNLMIKPYADIVEVLSGAGLSEEAFEKIGIQERRAVAFDLEHLFNIASAYFKSLELNDDWRLDYNSASDFKFCPYCYSFKSKGRRFYVLNIGNGIVLSNYRGIWGVVPLEYSSDKFRNYVPLNKENRGENHGM